MQEIERKFLVDNAKWKPKGKGTVFNQGYLSVDPKRTVRIRTTGTTSYITIKGETTGISRPEYEYEIPVEDAESLLLLCVNVPIVKTRYTEMINGLIWEIDVFDDANNGLILAEVELEKEDQTVQIPEWVKEEVSGDHRFYNSWLSQFPYSKW